jgi:hypothetical protein
VQARKPVSGWAVNEVNRIAAHPAHKVWLYLGETGLFESSALLEELKRRHYSTAFFGIKPRSGPLGYQGLFIYRVTE